MSNKSSFQQIYKTLIILVLRLPLVSILVGIVVVDDVEFAVVVFDFAVVIFDFVAVVIIIVVVVVVVIK
jgi:hypothetical protein